MFGMGRPTRPAAAPAPATRKAGARKAAAVSVTVKLEPRLRERFEALGGEAWLREQLEKAEVEAGP